MAWSRNGRDPERQGASSAEPRETDALLASNATSNGHHRYHHHHDDDPPPPFVSRSRALAIASSIGVLIFLQASNVSGMTMTQSAVAADLDAYEHAMWFSSVYLISAASFGPLLGRLATVFPLSHLLLGSSICFSIGAVITAHAASLPVFLAGRVVVGMGGAGAMTLSLITVLQLTTRHRRGLFVGLANSGFTLGLSTGAIVYGALLPVMSWRMLFLIQAPISLVAGICVFFSVPHFEQHISDGKDRSVWEKLARIDYTGAFFLTLTIVLLLYALSGTFRPLVILASLVSLAVFIAVECWFVPHISGGDPIIPFELLASRGVLLSCLAQLGIMAARWTILYYAPIFMLAVRGQSAALSGAMLIPTNAGFGSGGLLIGWLHIRRAGAFWLPCLVSMVCFSASLAVVGLLSSPSATFSSTTYVLALFANGFCTGAFLNYTLAHLLHLTRPHTHFVASSLLATFRSFSGSFGTAIGGGFFMRHLAGQLSTGFTRLDGGSLSDTHRALINRLIGSPALVFGTDASGHPALNEAQRHVAILGYATSLRSLYQVAALGSLLMLFVQAATGWTEPKSHAPVDHGPLSAGADDEDDEEEIEEEIREAIAEHDGGMEA